MRIIPAGLHSLHHQLTFWIDLIATRPAGPETCIIGGGGRTSCFLFKFEAGLQIAKTANITARIAKSFRNLKEAISKFYDMMLRSEGLNLTS